MSIFIQVRTPRDFVQTNCFGLHSASERPEGEIVESHIPALQSNHQHGCQILPAQLIRKCGED